MPRRVTFNQPPYLSRIMSPFKNPMWLDGNTWRNVVRSEPVFPICRNTIIQRLLSMEWTILPSRGHREEEYLDEIDYYTQLLQNANNEGYDIFLDLLYQDALDIPFGGICEVVYWPTQTNKDGTPKVWGVFNVDGATCAPTFAEDYPIIQIVPGEPKPIPLARGAFRRIRYSPRPELHRQGYGMAPPEQVYLALEMLVRGDRYYANLLTDTPEAGILDLMDMDEETANSWLDSFRALMSGIDPFKIPVLYEHDQPARFLTFGRPPTDLILDKQMLKYMSIAAAGYGLSLGDVNLNAQGGAQRSLSGGIREERQTRRTGIGTAVSKVEALFNSILPKYLKFKFQVEDEEAVVAKGRARATNLMAFSSAVQLGILSKSEVRQQLKADNLMDIDMPDDPPPDPNQQQMLPDYAQGQPGGYGGQDQLGGYQPNTNYADETVAPDSLGVDMNRDNTPASQGGMGGYGAYRSETMVNDMKEALEANMGDDTQTSGK